VSITTVLLKKIRIHDMLDKKKPELRILVLPVNGLNLWICSKLKASFSRFFRYMQKNGIEKRSVDESLFYMEGEENRTNLVRVKRDDYTEYKWAPGYVVGTSPQVTFRCT
jgi:hypothetical protein